MRLVLKFYGCSFLYKKKYSGCWGAWWRVGRDPVSHNGKMVYCGTILLPKKSIKLGVGGGRQVAGIISPTASENYQESQNMMKRKYTEKNPTFFIPFFSKLFAN